MIENNSYTENNTLIDSDPRLAHLNTWLAEQGYLDYSLSPASQDASFRRYFRMTVKSSKSFIVMDAPPVKESLSPFIEIAQAWNKSDISVPNIYAYSREFGYLILEDFGQQTFLNILKESSLFEQYSLAIDELIQIQKYTGEIELPIYTKDLLMQEMDLFREWFVEKHCNYKLSDNEKLILSSTFETLSQSSLQQKYLTVHRDYHSRNLMLKTDGSIGVIDFQDAVQGPISYDLVSLLKDCYIKLSSDQRDKLLNYYYVTALKQEIITEQSFPAFKKDFDFMGVQRHLKAIGIFCRLYHRDNKQNYLPDIPRTASYLFDMKHTYPELDSLIDLLQQCMHIFPKANEDGV